MKARQIVLFSMVLILALPAWGEESRLSNLHRKSLEKSRSEDPLIKIRADALEQGRILEAKRKASKQKEPKPPNYSAESTVVLKSVTQTDKTSGAKSALEVKASALGTSGVYQFADEFVSVGIGTTAAGVALEIGNAGSSTIEVIWSDSAIVMPSGVASKVALGSQKRGDMGEAPEKSIIPTGGRINEMVFAQDRVYFSSTTRKHYIRTMMPGYSEGDLAYSIDSVLSAVKSGTDNEIQPKSIEETKAEWNSFKGKFVTFVFVIAAPGKSIEYTCVSEITDVKITETPATE